MEGFDGRFRFPHAGVRLRRLPLLRGPRGKPRPPAEPLPHRPAHAPRLHDRIPHGVRFIYTDPTNQMRMNPERMDHRATAPVTGRPASNTHNTDPMPRLPIAEVLDQSPSPKWATARD